MTSKEKAQQLYHDAYRRWANKLSHDKNKLIAKSIAEYVCNEILNEYKSNETFTQPVKSRVFMYERIKQELEKL
jgi:hypothetical protein